MFNDKFIQIFTDFIQWILVKYSLDMIFFRHKIALEKKNI